MTDPAARTALSRVRRGPAVAAVAVAVALSLNGCWSNTEDDWDAIAVGEDGVAGSVELRSFLLVAVAEGEPGRLLGTFNNTSDVPVDITITDGDDTVTVTVPAEGQYPLDTNEVVFETVDGAPGSLTPITATTDEETTELSIPVRDGTLERYEPYLPE